MSLYRTQLNKTGIPGQVHTASVASLSSLKFFFSSHSRKHTGRLPELTSATINSPSHSYLIMTKHCNSPGSTHGTMTGYNLPQKDEKKRLGTNVPDHLFSIPYYLFTPPACGPSFLFSLLSFSLLFFIQSSIQSIFHFSILIHNCLNILSYTMLKSSSNYYS